MCCSRLVGDLFMIVFYLPMIIIRSNVKPHIHMIPDGTVFAYESEIAAIQGLKTAVAEGRVQILY